MKKIFKNGVSLLVMSMMLSIPTFAQTADSVKVAVADSSHTLALSLDEAKKYAVEHNRTIQNASYDVQKAEAARWKALAGMLLQVDGGVDYYNMFNYETEVMGVYPDYFQFTLNPTMTFSGSQLLGYQISKISKELSEITINQTEQTITSQIEKDYVQILVLEKTVRLLETNLENLQNTHKMTLNAVKVGAAEQNTADQLAIQVSSLSSNINVTKRTIEVLYNSIRLSTGANADDEIILTQKIEDIVNPGTILALMDSNLNMDDNYGYQLQKKSTEMSKKQLTLSKMAYFPTLTAFYKFSNMQYPGGELPRTESNIPNTIGAKMTIPIWSSGTRWADVRSAKMDYAKSLNEMKDTEQQLAIQEKQLRYNLTSAFENFQIQDENITVMQRVFNSNSEKFKYGTISSMQLTTSSTELISAQNTYVSSLLSLVEAYVDLRNLLNK